MESEHIKLKAEPIDENSSNPQPLECLQGNSIPPFLSKTFDLVDEPSLDPIISWSCTGTSFVVKDPVEFSKTVLPRNFKHNNISSFVRQLNTYGFRKIDADRLEFANEGFQRGKRELLKNIQRRRSPQSLQHAGSYSESASVQTGRGNVEGEIQRLLEEKNLLLQEVVELQQQHIGTVHHMEAVNEKIMLAEQRQKQMVSFVAKLFRNPAFLSSAEKIIEQSDAGSPRANKREHLNLQIVKYRPSTSNLPTISSATDLKQISPEQLPDSLLQKNVAKLGLNLETAHLEAENVASKELSMADEFTAEKAFLKNTGVGKGKASIGVSNQFSKEDFTNDPFVSSVNFQDVLSPGIESIIEPENIWSKGFGVISDMPNFEYDSWGNIIMNYDVPVFGGTSEFSTICDSDLPGSSGVHKWPYDEFALNSLDSQADEQVKDDIMMHKNP